MKNQRTLRTRCARLALPIALLFSALVTVNAAAAELTLPPIFANEMVLQRDKPVTGWGKSFAGDTITVSFGGASVKTTVEKEDWSVQLPAMPASAEGRTLTVAGKNGTKTFTDVLVGEVWLAGGQSNMSWHIGQEIDDKTFEMLQNYDYGRAADFPLDPAMFSGGNGEYSMALLPTGTSWRNHVSVFKSKDSIEAISGAVQAATGRSIAPTLFINYTVPPAAGK